MDELQGLHLINTEGYCHGIIERNFYNPNRQKYIIHFKQEDSSYKTIDMQSEEFNRYSSYAKLKSDRYDIIINRNINHIYHFSPIENTASILEHGILSRDYCNALGITNVITDPNRLDGELNKISASISYPNYKMKYSLEVNEGYRFVIYDINPRLLLSKLDIQFYHTNAACGIFNNINRRTLTTNEAFLNMFYEEYREPNLNISYTTDPQAEILVDTEIPKRFIEDVHTKYNDDNIKKLCIEKEYNYHPNYSIYMGRCDYARW